MPTEKLALVRPQPLAFFVRYHIFGDWDSLCIVQESPDQTVAKCRLALVLAVPVCYCVPFFCVRFLVVYLVFIT